MTPPAHASPFRLDSKNAIITGAGSGIGAAIARLFAQCGAAVSLLDRDEAAVRALAEELTGSGADAQAVPCDVSERASVEAAFAEVLSRRTRLDILVNSAGIAHIGNALNTPDADFERLFQVNVRGVWLCSQAALASMAPAGGGVILNLASTASLMGIADRFAYSMTKGAVLSMTMSIAKDFISQGIRCNAICPARIHTPFVDGFLARNYPGREAEMYETLSKHQPIGRMGAPEEVANLALFLCSDAAAYVTGCGYPLDGGTINLR